MIVVYKVEEKIKLSVIIPVYGVEDYIEDCISSLYSQLTKEVECIFINDGSKDRSIDILKNFLNKQSFKKNIRIIDQDNQGLSMARNNGVDLAEGDYVSFIDSDDYVLNDYIEEIINVIDHNKNVDLIHFNAIEENKFLTQKPLVLADQIELINNVNEEYLKRIFKKNKWYAWLRVYKKDLLKNIRFPKGYYFEDMLAVPFLYNENIKIYELNKTLIFYRYRPSSISNCSVNEKHLESLFYGVDLFRDNRDKCHFKQVYIHLILGLFNNFIKMNFKKYCCFINSIKFKDLNYIKNNSNELHWKVRWMLKTPKFFYLYKNWLGLRKHK